MNKTGLIVALDDPDIDAAEVLAGRLAAHVAAFKVGLTLFSAAGPQAVDRIGRHGRVFCDLKFHDIPHQVQLASAELARQGAWMFTIHASGGPSMIQAASTGAAVGPETPLIAAVTVLTALSQSELAEVGQGSEVESQVIRLAEMAVRSGATALVCSARHLKEVRRIVGEKIVLVTPGIREPKDRADDQVQTATAAQASADGADFIVVGRPVSGAEDPVAAVRRFSQQL